MEERRIGSLRVSVLGLGCNNFGRRLDYESTVPVVEAALAAGINFFDTADIYGEGRSEELLGRALGGRRDQVVIATKFGMEFDKKRRGAKPAYVRQAAEDSLRRLGTDHIDLYQLHEPDRRTPIGETLAALDELVRSGKVREIGCSNFSAEQLREAEAVAAAAGTARFVSVQNEYSLVHREPERAVLAECVRLGLAFIPFFPLASGLLTGKYRRGEAPPENTRLSTSEGLARRFLSERNREIAEALAEFAAARGHSLLELAFSWLLSRPAAASVIAGATSAEQVRANAGALTWQLSPAELAEIDRLAPPER
jgi:aryl-alcohol dehydrogenase-like predicted oxidoreductase